MNLQEELKALKERIAELEEQVKYDKWLPQEGDIYFYISRFGSICCDKWDGNITETHMFDFDNVYENEEQAEFAVEKLKVEAELRKFSRPFKDNDNNYYIELYLFDKTLSIDSGEYFQTQGTIYFESTTVAQQAVNSIGEERIKKYIFGVED